MSQNFLSRRGSCLVPDTLTPARRSANMRAVKSKNTKPEMLVRRMVFAQGHRFRLHARELPGKPDIVFRPRKKCVFVHGCFWHLHDAPSCKDARLPKSNRRYWGPKLRRNKARDAGHLAALKKLGWKTLVIWECETRKPEKLKKRLEKFLAG